MFGKKKDAIEVKKPKPILENPIEKVDKNDGKNGFQNNPSPVVGTSSPTKEAESKRPIEKSPTSNKEEKPLAPKSVKPAPRKIGSEGVPLERYTDKKLETSDYKNARQQVIEILLENVDFDALSRLSAAAKKEKITQTTKDILEEVDIPLNNAQQQALRNVVIDEILGFGPLEPLLRDKDVADIMVNTKDKIYIEKDGKLLATDIKFNSESHLLNVIQKIVSRVGRTVDETSPMVDARLPDGSRFNAIIPPLALDGSLVSIRKFKQDKMALEDYLTYGSLTPEMMKFLDICASIRLNILVSGGTGSGKTTMLNALSGKISPGERVITIEDAAELQLKQPHVLRLETRPSNSEGVGEITQRMLVKNALRMRPDRIILGEIRGDEVIDVLAAMNTGHEGSMSTIHANNPRDCLSRIENLVGLAGISMPIASLRRQVSGAIHLIVQLSRMRDGVRRVTHIEEIVGMEGDIITTQPLFTYKAGTMGEDGKLQGTYESSGLRPKFYEQAVSYGRGAELDELLKFRK